MEKLSVKNLFSINRDIATIVLTQSKVVCIDTINLSLISKHRWCTQKNSNTWYAVTVIRSKNKCRTTLYMHRLLMGLQFGDIRQVDHHDGNGLNNCLNNLTITTHTGNQHNLHSKKLNYKYKIPTSKILGVSWHKRTGKWRTQIRYKNQSIHLGCYDSEIEARDVYLVAKTIRDANGNIDEIRSVVRRRQCLEKIKKSMTSI